MKKIKFLLSLGVLTILLSCSKEQSNVNLDSIITENGQISKTVANDSLFVELDKALYEVNLNFLKYSNVKVDKEKSDKLIQDLRDHKFKNMTEFSLANEKIGNTDHLKRRKAQIKAIKAKEDLFKKYPELKTIPFKRFFEFYKENRKYKMSQTEINNNLEKLKEEREQ